MFLKFHDSHSSPYCYEEQISAVQISKLTHFLVWCLLFLPFSLNNELGKRAWLTKSCHRTLSSLTHESPELQLELSSEGFLPLTDLLTFAKAWSPGAGSHTILRHHGQDRNSRDKTGAAKEELSLLWGLRHLSAVPPFAAPPSQIFRHRGTTE